MAKSLFRHIFLSLLDRCARLELGEDDRVVIFSDLHMGDGGRMDDLTRNEALLSDALERYYLPGGYNLVLNGDVEELQRFKLPKIYSRWVNLYSIFDRFYERGKLYKILGNHDDLLALQRGYPYQLLDSVHIDTPSVQLYVYHGHQASNIYMKYSGVMSFLLRWFVNPLGIGNISAARSPRKRFHVEKQAYELSRENGFISVIGHTHRSLFESLSRYDYIKFEIERLCRDYPAADGDERLRIGREVSALRVELKKLRKKEKKSSIIDSLYGDELPVPCLFNSGSCIGKKGIYSIEIDNQQIRMVYWFTEGNSKKFINRGGYEIHSIPNTSSRWAVVSSDRLEYVKARIDLLS